MTKFIILKAISRIYDDFNLIKQNYPGYKLIYVYKISDNKDNLITPSTFLSDMKFINKLDQYFFYEVYNN